jgi:hypothetical protein
VRWEERDEVHRDSKHPAVRLRSIRDGLGVQF